VEVARDFAVHYLPPEIAALLDPTTLSISKDSLVDEEMVERFSDLLDQIQFNLIWDLSQYSDEEIRGGGALRVGGTACRRSPLLGKPFPQGCSRIKRMPEL